MRTARWSLGIDVVVIAIATQAALAQISLTDGNANFTLFGASPTNPFSNSFNNLADFRPDGGSSTDHVAYYNWGFRVPLGLNTGLSELVQPLISTPDSRTAIITMLKNGPGPIGQSRFDSTVTIRLIEGELPGEARLVSTLSVTALPSNSALVFFRFFHIVDVDFNGTAASDVFNILNSAGVDGTIVDTALSSPATSAKFYGQIASRYRVDFASTMRSIVNGGGNSDIQNAETFTGDGAYGFQWTVALNPGQSAEFTSYLLVPEPISLGLLTPAILFVLRRRR